eukprot:Gregarina_sp_Poly_1__3206@NODE_1912_length_3099_cov_79_291227_g1234_i0_p1_GENE_NODE_1912_length_3099_cov_79_291227_g1234_i0NODE_1912_length_3099_cov_79_291227_g1234_i0_p1_ORF_typecomplete_len424_score44_70SLC35F/PF06027_12/1_8e16Nuc_sug_transp/PF04142_15/2e03Nuc_sug_transp/PF04142_15/2_5e11PUNUT/PF16913_5/1_4e08CRTlike/PF08627_10/1_3e08TPT/PF03151_16/1_3e03TPT/PF03151_16/1_6e08UAA/PF08449_11/3e05EamA/PF00892_20/1_2e02EamA/PF00892_20/0_0016EamA/PF00892_20/1_2e03Mg_trans_NIPA/PF05653_14/6_6Mg_tran
MQSPTLIADAAHSPRESRSEFDPVPGWWLQAAIYMSMFSGIGAIMSQKAMNRIRYWRCDNVLAPECSISYFSSPLWQIILGAIGGKTASLRGWFNFCSAASACWGLYSWERYCALKAGKKRGQFELLVHQESLLKPESGYVMWIIPACFEFAAGWLCNLAMTITYASTVLMLRTFNTAVVALITTFWLRTPLRLYHWYGVAIVTLGTCIASVFAAIVEDPNTPYSKTESYIGAIAAILSCIFTSRMAPFKAAGIQGLVQCIVASVALTMSWDARAVRASTYQLRNSTELQRMALVFVTMIFFFNASLIVISKLASSLLRTILHAFRTMLIYLIELFIGWSTFHWLDLSSIITSILGLLVYTNVLPTPLGDKIVTGDPHLASAPAVELAAMASETGNPVNLSHTLLEKGIQDASAGPLGPQSPK